MAQIKITHTSNADMNIGVPKQITMAQDDYKMKSTETVTNNHKLTAVEWLFQKMTEQGTNPYWDMRFIQAKQIEREQLAKAMHHALDEDGHTGDWKLKFINDYYESNFGVRPQ